MFEIHPKTKKLLHLFANADYGTEFSYALILQETGCDLVEDDRQRIYTVVGRLERDHHRTLLNVRGMGYKVAQPNEFVGSMRVRNGRAKRHVSLARRTGDAAPREMLTDPERQELTDQMAFVARVNQAFLQQSQWNYRTTERIAMIEEELRELRSRETSIEGSVVE